MVARQHARRREGTTTTTLTKAVPHIRLEKTNACKLAALDALAPVYMVLCQAYVTYFCTEEEPDKFHEPVFATPLSERWHRVAIQQAAGIARSWRTNREQAYQSYLEEIENFLGQASRLSPQGIRRQKHQQQCHPEQARGWLAAHSHP